MARAALLDISGILGHALSGSRARAVESLRLYPGAARALSAIGAGGSRPLVFAYSERVAEERARIDDLLQEAGVRHLVGDLIVADRPLSFADLRDLRASASVEELYSADPRLNARGLAAGMRAPLADSSDPAVTPVPAMTQVALRPYAFHRDYEPSIGAISGTSILSRVQRYSDPGGELELSTRQLGEDGNVRAIDALLADLRAVGVPALVHPFGTNTFGRCWNVVGELAGTREGVVIVSAHLDSLGEPHDAPGADDNASGIAATLEIARVASELYRSAPRERLTLRFVLFNGEEHLQMGSERYASEMRLLREPIVALLQLDTMGWIAPGGSGSDTRGWDFEVHSGSRRNPEAGRGAFSLASDVLAATAVESSGLRMPFVTFDEAATTAEKSDHAPFLARGYRAVVVSENLGSRSGALSMNPNLHTRRDRDVNPEYCAAITRACARTAMHWVDS